MYAAVVALEARIRLVGVVMRDVCCTYYEHTDHRDHADHDSEAIIVPASAVCEPKDRAVYITMWSHDPKWYNYGEYTQNMQNEHDCFRQWQTLGEKYIEQRTANDNAHRQQGLVPRLDLVSRRIESSESEDKGCLQTSQSLAQTFLSQFCSPLKRRRHRETFAIQG